ncbi:unnamed protein product [Callosobruchus maculatus]|uniref:Uncharacterized protein n=1 Tax=Callosobruchus maculatus TaxID=64391 RepID=A0A653BWY2_CALMS|nr:unnamed protein product [Callosobruchus maculatus]
MERSINFNKLQRKLGTRFKLRKGTVQVLEPHNRRKLNIAQKTARNRAMRLILLVLCYCAAGYMIPTAA